ncbi:hypothetical protein G2W53_039096 [Senna tora]|uniref:Uncharacterized protein n=1 Tax=Senna tora TaxID=362788 RepID=A0A834SLY9_9FABA|nr:hypothetical protein G2W53_039096 [Senna tora]
MFGEINRDEASTAPHPSKIIAQDIPSELVMIHDHRRERRRRIEQAAVHHQDPDLLRLHSGLLEQPVDGAEHHLLRLLPRLRHARVRRHAHHRRRQVRVLSQSRSLQDLLLERQVLRRERPRQVRPLHEDLARARVGRVGLVAVEVEEEDGPGAAREVEREEEDGEGGAEREGEEVEGIEAPPEVEEVRRRRERREVRRRRAEEGDQDQVWENGE